MSPAARRAPRSSATCCSRARPSRSGPRRKRCCSRRPADDHIRCTILPALDGGAMGRQRPLRRFHARLSGRARRGGSAPDQGARARVGRRPASRPDLGAGCAGQDRPSAGGRPPGWRRVRIASSRRTIEFHERLRASLSDARRRRAPERCVIIDASAPKMTVAKQIWQAVNARLRARDGAGRFADAAS